jgi:hypothetical protein
MALSLPEIGTSVTLLLVYKLLKSNNFELSNKFYLAIISMLIK